MIISQPTSLLIQKNKKMADRQWWFILGREQKISVAEITTLLNLNAGQFSIANQAPLLFCPPSDISAPTLIEKLGGTIKIAEEIGQSLQQTQLLSTIKKELKNIKGKIIFGLSAYSSLDANTLMYWGKKIKMDLKSEQLSVRYIPNKDIVLSSATVDHNHLISRGAEFIIYEESPQKFSLAKTIALQPYAAFSRRDFDRPGRDHTSGMLPPKLAMIMINLAAPQKNDIILDPFCGSGTIITEAMIMGYNKIIGSDISARAIADTQKNIDWTIQNLNVLNTKITLYNTEIKILTEKIKPASIQRIITEPFLGKPLTGRETWSELEQQSRDLKKLYETAFETFKKIMYPQGIVVFIFPRFHVGKKNICTNLLEKITKFGFKHLPFFQQNCLTYERPGQKITREIWKFQKI